MTLLTRAEFARARGVNRATVTKWIHAGRVEVDASGRIDPAAADHRLAVTESPQPHHQARLAQIEEARAQPREAPADTAPPVSPRTGSAEEQPGMPPAEKLALAYKTEVYRHQKAKAELANLELDKAAGLLVERIAVESLLADLGATWRRLLGTLADRATPEIMSVGHNATEIHAAIDATATAIGDALLLEIQRREIP